MLTVINQWTICQHWPTLWWHYVISRTFSSDVSQEVRELQWDWHCPTSWWSCRWMSCSLHNVTTMYSYNVLRQWLLITSATRNKIQNVDYRIQHGMFYHHMVSLVTALDAVWISWDWNQCQTGKKLVRLCLHVGNLTYISSHCTLGTRHLSRKQYVGKSVRPSAGWEPETVMIQSIRQYGVVGVIFVGVLVDKRWVSSFPWYS